MATKASTKILAISPYMKSELGHFYSYHTALSSAAESLNWRYVVAGPVGSQASPWPVHWEKCLEPVSVPFKPKFLGRLYGKYRAYHSLGAFLQRQLAREGRNIIFLEFFSARDLRMLFNCLRFRKPTDCSLWLLFREHPGNPATNTEKYSSLVHKLKDLLGENNLRILSDTEVLAALWSECLGLPVQSTPIPLASKDLPEPFKKPADQITCWWPGVPQTSKGLNIIQELLHSSDPNAQQLVLVAADVPALSFSTASTPFIKLATPLPEADYLRWMATCDVILLPYNHPYYKTGSSGILVQAVSHGKVPLVHEGTWMAGELRRFGLDRLVLDWEGPDVPSLIPKLVRDPVIRDQLKSMQAAYRQYHSIPSFSHCMQQLQPMK